MSSLKSFPFAFPLLKREEKSFNEGEKHQVLILENSLASRASRTTVSFAKIVVHFFPHAFVCTPVALGAEVGACSLGLPVGLDVGFFRVGAWLGLPEGLDVGFFRVGAWLGLPEGLEVGFFRVGAWLGLPEGLDVGFFLVGADVGARLGFPAVTDVGFLDGPTCRLGFLVGLIEARSSIADRAPQTPVITASEKQMWMVFMSTFACSQMTCESEDLTYRNYESENRFL